MSAETEAGFAALQRGDLPTALTSLEAATQQDPEDYQAHLYLGAAYVQAGRAAEAVQTLTRAVHIQPASAQARYNLGVALERGGWPEQALTAYQQAVQLQPVYPQAQEAARRLQAPPPPSPGLPAAAYPAPAYGGPAPGQPLYSPTASAPVGLAPTPTLGLGAYRPVTASDTLPEPQIGIGLAAGAGVALLFGLVAGFLSVGAANSIPLLTIFMGRAVGYTVLKASREPGETQGYIAAACAVFGTLLAEGILLLAGFRFNSLSIALALYAGYRGYRIASD
ncbi:MAG TPA: tetratricopeptide repeat protein [Chthonomonadaceae bacterium]|nr:tetratricopeptide repeat protein [Chthonomonadaceae bacterium]